MNHEHEHHQGPQQRKSLPGWVFWGFLAIAAFFLLSEHRAHALGWLPWLILLACPLMHLFGHGGHEHGRGQEQKRDQGGHRHD